MPDTDKNTHKVKRATGEPTDKVKQLDLLTIIKWAKGNPWVLLVLASGSGVGGQEIANAIGQNVQWWWIALGVAGFAVIKYMTDKAKRDEKFRDDIRLDVADIKTSLRVGAEKFDHIERDVKSLRDWRHELNNKLMPVLNPPKRTSSKGGLKPHGGQS